MSRAERALLWGSTVLVAVSGTVVGVMKYLLTPDDPFAVVNHPWQPFFLKLHVLSAPLLVFAMGVVFSRHVWRHYRGGLPAGRRSGVFLATTFAAMALSGYLVQVVTDRGWLFAIVASHLVTGGVFVVALAGHQIAARIRARREDREEDRSRSRLAPDASWR